MDQNGSANLTDKSNVWKFTLPVCMKRLEIINYSESKPQGIFWSILNKFRHARKLSTPLNVLLEILCRNIFAKLSRHTKLENFCKSYIRLCNFADTYVSLLNQRAELKEQCNEKRIQEDKHFRMSIAKGKDMKSQEGRKENEELSTPRLNAMFGLCAICHLTLGNINSNLNENVPCSKGHALCQRCIQHFAVQSGRDCILCHAQYQQSSINFSRESVVSINSTHACLKRTEKPRAQFEYYYTRNPQWLQQNIPINIKQSYTTPWNENYSPAVSNIERNTLGYHNDTFAETSDREQIRDQCNFGEEQVKGISRQKQQISSYNLFKKGNGEPYICDTKVNGQITAECSRRPIRCPRIDCAINVAFSALTHHFIFDHPEVPILNVEPGIKSTLIVSFNALSSNSSRCLALLLVSDKLSDPVARLFNSSQINPKYRNRLPLSVLAARLQSTNQYISNEKINKKKSSQEKDIIIAWVAGLDIGNATENLLCSIQAVDKMDNEGLRSLTYTGPVNSLRTAQCPQAIFATGDCIVLHEGLLRYITSDCATLNVNVTVH